MKIPAFPQQDLRRAAAKYSKLLLKISTNSVHIPKQNSGKQTWPKCLTSITWRLRVFY